MDTNNHHFTDWSSIVKEEETLHFRRESIGSEFRTAITEHSRERAFASLVTGYTPHDASIIQTGRGAFSPTADYKFEKVPQGPRVYSKRTGFFRTLLPIMVNLMRKSNRQSLQNELCIH